MSAEFSRRQHTRAKVSVVIVTWNSERYIPFVFESLRNQSFTDFNVIVIDNASVDKTVAMTEAIGKELVTVVSLKENSGFARGYNLGIHWSDGEYVLIMNDDVVLDQDYLQEAVQFMDVNEKVGVLQGKVLHWDVASNRKQDTVDTLGIDMLNNLSFVNRHEGEISPKLEREAIPVFGFSGCCALLRKTALKSVQYQQEFFDELFFMYKEDIDLSWRLRHMNWDIVYFPPAISYHGRTLKKPDDQHSNIGIAAHRVTKSAALNMISYRNHLAMLYKNCFMSNVWHVFRSFMWYECKKIGYILLAEPKTLLAFKDLLLFARRLYRKRKHIMETTKIDGHAINAWIQ